LILKQAELVEKEINKIKNELETLKAEEIRRLDWEFTKNDYERRYKVTLTNLITYLIGAKNIFEELARINREHVLFMEKLSSCKIFNNLESTVSKVIFNSAKK
jgi:HKD family nuclease